MKNIAYSVVKLIYSSVPPYIENKKKIVKDIISNPNSFIKDLNHDLKGMRDIFTEDDEDVKLYKKAIKQLTLNN